AVSRRDAVSGGRRRDDSPGSAEGVDAGAPPQARERASPGADRRPADVRHTPRAEPQARHEPRVAAVLDLGNPPGHEDAGLRAAARRLRRKTRSTMGAARGRGGEVTTLRIVGRRVSGVWGQSIVESRTSRESVVESRVGSRVRLDSLLSTRLPTLDPT